MSFREDYLATSAGELARHFNAAATAHICVDLQKGYCAPPLPFKDLRAIAHQYFREARETIRNIADFSQTFAIYGGHNIWVRHDVRFDTAQFKGDVRNYRSRAIRLKLNNFAQRATELCLPCPEQAVIDKKDFSSFNGTPLTSRLHQQNVSTIMVSGGYRDYCVAETALDAKKQGFRTFIVDDLVISNQFNTDQSDLEKFCNDYAKKGIFIVTSDKVKKILSSALHI